jgi:hypothetical protein
MLLYFLYKTLFSHVNSTMGLFLLVKGYLASMNTICTLAWFSKSVNH